MSLHTKNQVSRSKTDNFSFLGVSKKVRNVCRIRQKSKNELTRLHVGQKHPFTQKIRSLAQKRSILTQNGVCQNRCAYDCRLNQNIMNDENVWKGDRKLIFQGKKCMADYLFIVRFQNLKYVWILWKMNNEENAITKLKRI